MLHKVHKPSTAGPGEGFLAPLTYFGPTALPSSGGEVQGDLSVVLPPGTNFRDQIYRKIAANQRS